jgi:hypothetical protein
MPNKKVFMLLYIKSRIPTFYLLFFLSAFFSSYNATGQAGDSQVVYVAINYIKTHPGKQGAYLDLQRNYSKQIWEYHVKQGHALGYYINSIVMPVGASTEYDVSIVAVSPNLQFLLDDSISVGSIYKQLNPGATDGFVQSILDQYSQVRTLVKREIFIALARTEADVPPTKYYTVDYMKTTPGKATDYEKLEKEVWMPIHKEQLKLGVLKNWVFLKKDMPYKITDLYDYQTVHFFNDVKFTQGNATLFEAAKKAFPNKDMRKSYDLTDASRTLVMTELWKLELYVDPSNTKN